MWSRHRVGAPTAAVFLASACGNARCTKPHAARMHAGVWRHSWQFSISLSCLPPHLCAAPLLLLPCWRAAAVRNTQDPLQTAKGPLLPDSSILLLRLQAPTLFVQAAGDSKHPPAQMRKVAAQMKPATVPRLVEVPDVDAAFEAGDPPVLQPETLEAVTKPIVEFVNAVGANSLDNCSLPPANPSGTAATELSDSAAAQIQAQIQILDADDTAVYDVEPLGRPGEAPGSGANGAQQRAVQQQQLLQQQLQIQVLQQQQAQQVQLAAAAAKAGISMQQAAAQRAAAAAVAAAGAAGKIPLNLAAAAAAAAAAGSAGAAGAGPAASGAPIVLGAGGFTQITPQMLAAAQAMQLAAAKQGMRPVLPAAAAAAAAAAQQQQGAQQHAKDS